MVCILLHRWQEHSVEFPATVARRDDFYCTIFELSATGGGSGTLRSDGALCSAGKVCSPPLSASRNITSKI